MQAACQGWAYSISYYLLISSTLISFQTNPVDPKKWDRPFPISGFGSAVANEHLIVRHRIAIS
jgi:hypothetical protein